MPKETVYDILVFGAGPAGSASALFATAKELKTAVVHRGAAGGGGPQPEWFHPRGAELIADQGLDLREAVLGTIDRIRFVDVDCKHEVRAAIGRKIDIVDSGRLAETMLGQAKTNGAEVFADQVKAVQIREGTVCLVTDGGRSVAGQVLIAADGSSSLACRAFQLEREAGIGRRTICCETVVGRLDPKRRGGSRPAEELTLLLASDDMTGFGYCFAVGEAVVVGLVAPESSADAGAELGGYIRRWQQAGFVPSQVDAAKLPVSTREVPRGLALGYDTHVGKHALFIGDAGGYVAAISHEGLYPAIWSAQLAMDVCGEALASKHSQDTLMEFDSRWRQEMADYMRPPNSDLRFLLPLIFSNQRMAEKLAQAFFFGTNL